MEERAWGHDGRAEDRLRDGRRLEEEKRVDGKKVLEP